MQSRCIHGSFSFVHSRLLRLPVIPMHTGSCIFNHISCISCNNPPSPNADYRPQEFLRSDCSTHSSGEQYLRLTTWQQGPRM